MDEIRQAWQFKEVNRTWTGGVCQALYICIKNKNKYGRGKEPRAQKWVGYEDNKGGEHIEALEKL